MKEMTYVIKSELGLHVRPAGMLSRLAARYQSNIQVQCGERSSDAKRIISLMGMNIKQGERIKISMDGADEEAAFTAIQDFLIKNL